MFNQQKQIIANFVSKNPNLSTREIANQLGLNYNSVRGRVSNLKKSKILAVNDKNQYTFIGSWWKKILKTGTTEKAVVGGNESVWAYTFESGATEEPDRYNFLKKIIKEEFDITVPRGGYDFQEVNEIEKEESATYPSYESGAGVYID